MGQVEGALSIFDPKRGGPGVPPELQGVLDDIGKLGTLNVDQAQNIRSRLGEIAGQASVAATSGFPRRRARCRTPLRRKCPTRAGWQP